ncbi:MAG TPA: adenylyltransferase/cytidyltransferase family protein [Candidatus Nanoarchaeia archaeon]|nr:adenylyltransferase/cytidyltransferase family protein [Candidatus Nanoarchaeia archaeon]
MKTVMCFGTFDVLHLGHLFYLKEAKKHGDYLIVVVARNETKQQQRKKMVFSEEERRALLQQLKVVDEAVLGYPDDHLRIIAEKKPDVLILGYDQALDAEELAARLQERQIDIPIFRAQPYRPETQKSSQLRAQLFDRDKVFQ